MHRGHLYAFLGFGIWGFVPIYWKQLVHYSSLELFAHRLWWSSAIFLVLLGYRPLLEMLKKPRELAALSVTSALVMSNWYLFVWAVNSGHIVEASLGYFLNPLLSILLGVFLLKESLRPLQWVAVGLASVGLLFKLFLPPEGSGLFHSETSLWVSLGISIGLAITFALYGLIRKVLSISPAQGLFTEVTLAVIPLSIYIFFFKEDFMIYPQAPVSEKIFLFFAGPLTLLPLFFFNKAVKLLKLSIIGLINYLSPILQLLCGVWLYQEPFGTGTLLTFVFVWLALALFSYDRLRSKV